MPTIDYYGHRINIDIAYSYDRVSSPQQTPAHGGEGIDRQALLRKEFSERFGVPIDHELVDLGKSGSTGAHLEDGGALAGFMALATGKIKGKKLKRHPALIIESFSRLCRLPIDDAMSLFLDIIRAGVTLITLVDHRAYTQASLRANPGEIHTVAAHLQAARAEAEARGYFSRSSWAARRHKVIAMCPGWMVPNADRNAYDAIDGAKEIFRRMFREGEDLGDEKIAARFNQDDIKPFASWNHKSTIWYGNHIRALITGRAVRGEREVWHYDGKSRTKTGQVIHIYPEMISEEQWQRTNAARAARQQQITAGRKGDGFANLFQSLAKCAHCGKAMKLSSTRKRGKLYQYYRCANLRRRGCDHPYTYNYQNVESLLLGQLGVVAFAETSPEDDPAEAINTEIADTQAEIDALVRRRVWIEKLLQKVAEEREDGDFNPADRKQGHEMLGIYRDIEAKRVKLAKRLTRNHVEMTV